MAGQDDAKSKTTPKKASVATIKPQPKPKPIAKPAAKKAPVKTAPLKQAVSKPTAAKPQAAPKASKPPIPAKSVTPTVAKAAEVAAPPKPAAAPVAVAEPVPAAKAGEPVKLEPAKLEVPKTPEAPKPAPAAKAAPAPKPTKTELAVAKTPIAETASKTVTPPAAFAGLFTNFILEDSTMDMNVNIKDAMSDAQTKAKAAFEKGTEVLGEVSDFTKGNVEAVIESGKIFAEGMQGMGSSLVSESRASFEAMTGDIKELAAAKSPTDFFKLQGDMMRKNFDSAVATGSKNSEAMLKLMSDVMAPISGRFSLAMEKVRTAA
ncbi:phasin family protein [Novosphingobium sp. 9]|uniref:phasin family protein n=1 Tax=Novosphingobium sp. 9 TaxID=2025349 RepID=UPI0021B5B2E2|nr:phasin family protein [Novosphingobium sp. 9]